jgi:hypothetical protein
MIDAESYFTAKLQHETDASDVYAAQKAGDAFVLVDVRGDEALTVLTEVPHSCSSKFLTLGRSVA